MSDNLLRPAALPTWGQRTALRLLNMIGWKLYHKPLPGPHGIAVVYPHTSNWDFLIGLLGKWALGLQFRWLAKDSLFRGPMGATHALLGRCAGRPPRADGGDAHAGRAHAFRKWCWVAITPEGTRSYRPHWKSGFYHLAMAARVPLVLVYLDYRKKELSVADIVHLSGNQDADMAAIAAVYKDKQALYPEHAAPIQLAPPHTGPERRKRA
jgi:hypothetical protein